MTNTVELVPETVEVTPAVVVEEVPKPEITFETLVEEAGKKSESNISFIRADLFVTHVEIETNPKIKKAIDYISFKNIINSLCQVQEEAVLMKGFLPPSNMFFFGQNADEMQINCYYPECVRPLLYEDGRGSKHKKMDIITPNIILSIIFRKEKSSGDWIVKEVRHLSTPHPISKLPTTFISGPSKSHGIYPLPMSNTYGQGNMCYGGNQMPARFKDNNLRGVDWYYKYLWESPFNNDLGIRAIGDAYSVSEWYGILAKCAENKEPFPYKYLR